MVWPQLISLTGSPMAAASFSRLAGLGVQRPSTMAATRSSGNAGPLRQFVEHDILFFQPHVDGLHNIALALKLRRYPITSAYSTWAGFSWLGFSGADFGSFRLA